MIVKISEVNKITPKRDKITIHLSWLITKEYINGKSKSELKIKYEDLIKTIDKIERGELEDLKAPELWIDPNLTDLQNIDDRELSNVKVLNYKHHGPIKFPLAQ